MTSIHKLLTFQESLDRSVNDKRHLLLGNGFSISWKNGIFNYDSLFSRAVPNLSQPAKDSFNALHTTDFEYLILLRDPA